MRQRITIIFIVLSALISVKAKADAWAVKSNLLYDVAGAPNLGIEYGWKGHWSLAADMTMPWYVDDQNEWCYEMLNVGVEARYWLKDWQADNKLHGHFLGLYGNGGCFDFGHDRMGWQSKWFTAVGVSYGYNFRLSQHLRLECNIGIGYLNTDYTRYNTYDDNSGIYFVEDGNYSWFGPTKAGVSLLWVF
ncbi:MAG: DUF3575 domain-containing protein [Prevotellaceae bacterium]|nr:DUF3575 domain-containing protein [Prevotellaceae bacterium]